jgi:hypothetical protein
MFNVDGGGNLRVGLLIIYPVSEVASITEDLIKEKLKQ